MATEFKPVVMFADRFYMAEASLAELDALGGYSWADAADAADLAGKLEKTPSARIIVSEYVPVNALVLDRAPHVKGVISYGAGYDHIDVRLASGRNVLACNCRGENAQAVAELTFAVLLNLIRKLRKAEDWVRQGGWAEGGRSLPGWIMGRELRGKTLGIVGLGQIGSRVARIARGFDMEILGYDPVPRPLAGIPETSLEALFARSDIITLHVPLTEKTEKMVDARVLSAMKPGALIVNTSRGRVVDESPLLAALRNQKIGGAALDVFAGEPIAGDHPFARLENVVLTPHMGAMTEESGDRLSQSIVRQAKDILAGRRPEGLIA